MVKEITLIAAMAALSLVVIAKGDKQLTHILEGKLFHLDQGMANAALVYGKHRSPLAVILFVLGFAMIGVSVILLANGNSIFLFSGVLSLVLLSSGIWYRISSFRAAGRELDAARLARRTDHGDELR
jgi:hypothetical protein